MRILVTGGAGFIGSHLVDRFLQEGFQVRILDSLDPRVHPRGKPDYLPAQAEFIEGDVRDREILRYALRHIDVVCHQAAYQDYMPDFSRFFSVNAVGTALIYELVVSERQLLGVRHSDERFHFRLGVVAGVLRNVDAANVEFGHQ